MTTLDSQRGDVAIIVAAGGAGVRLGAGMPKALCRLAGETLLQHTIRRLTVAGSVGSLVVSAPPGHEPEVRSLLPAVHGVPAGEQLVELVVVTGGAHRQQSVALALSAVPPEYEIVLVHDAARALTPPGLVEEVVGAVRAGHDAVIPVLPVPDTMVGVDPTGAVTGTVDRSALRAVQTPQGFRRAVLEAAHAAASDHAATDDAGLVARLGLPVHTIPGSPFAFKITTPHDLTIAEALCM